MFSRFTSMLHHAVEALAPNMPLQQDFVSHWKAITHYFIENKDHKVSIEQTSLPQHLDHMLDILLQEEGATEAGSTGPCMEYALQHKILETLYTLARTDCPPGMKQQVLLFFTKLLSRIKQPLLPHVNVHRAVHRLIRVCGEVKAAPTENEEIQFLCTVCAKLRSDPYLVNFFIEIPKMRQQASSSSENGADDNEVMQVEPKPVLSLVDSLLSLMHSADARVAVKACEGLMLCAGLPEKASTNCIVKHTRLCQDLADQLCTLYNKLPIEMDPADISSVEAKWGLDMMCESEDLHNFPGKRSLISFLSWLDYCDQFIMLSQPDVATAMARCIRDQFLTAVLEPALLQPGEAGAITATAHLNRCLRLVTSQPLISEFVLFILGDEREPEVPAVISHKLRQRLVERCDHLSEEMSLTTMKLFETLLQKPDEHIYHNLVLRNLIGRSYLGDSLKKSEDSPEHTTTRIHDSPEQTGDTETELPPKSVQDDDDVSSQTELSPPSSPSSSQNGPSVHKVVNSFLCMLPEEAKSSYLMADSGYDTYLRDAHRQFSDVSSQCLTFNWPQQALCEQSYIREPFYEGSFLKVLLDRLIRMLDQSYDVNLQVTSIVSRLALVPHPNLHEYLLNPMLSLCPGVRSLTSSITKVVHDVESRVKTCSDLQKDLLSVRRQLMGVDCNIRRSKSGPQTICLDDSNMLEGVIVLEEFCKELAAVAFVKYHTTSTQ